MRAWVSRHLTYANVVSTACLFIVLGGTSYAAVKITGKDVKRETLTGANVKDGTLLRKDFKKGQLPVAAPGPSGPQGSPGAQGPAGADGATSPPPPGPPTPVGQQLTISRSIGAPIVIPVLSSSFDGSIEGKSGGGGGGGGGKAVYEELLVTTPVGASGDDLFQAATKGTHLPAAKLELSAPGGSGASASLELGETFITKLANAGSGDSRAQTVGLKVGDPSNQTTSPPRLTWTPGATGLPIGMRKVGEMTIAGLAGPIDLFSADWSVKQAGDLSSGGGGGLGKLVFEDLSVVKAIDASSPELLKAMKTGKTFAKAEVELLQPGSTSLSTRYTLTDAQITDYRLTVGPGAPEALTLSYGSIEQAVPGPGGTELKSCWDLALNSAC